MHVSPKKVNFGKQSAGAPSAPRTVTLTNKGPGDLAAPAVAVDGTGFILSLNGCTGSVPVGSSCPVSVVFQPPSAGKFKHGLLKFADGAAKSPQKVKLMGIGLPASFTPTATLTITPTPTSSATATASATPTATPAFNKVFMTLTGFDGDLGGQAGADAKCAAEASGAGLSGTYVAWLSTSGMDAKDKLGSARGFMRTDGQPFADQVSDIVAGKILNPINVDASGVPLSGTAWTGTLPDGTVTGLTCGDWTSNSNVAGGIMGSTARGPEGWTDFQQFGCNFCCFSLICFDTTHDTQLTVTPTAGRIAFVSKAAFDTTSGLAGADALCATEASAASLTGTFQALLSITSQAASSRAGFDFSAMSAPYVRPDGILIGDAPTIASGSALSSGIWQNADGTYATGMVWTGSSSPSTTSSNDCAHWANNTTASGIVGDKTAVSGWFNSGSLPFCSASASVYCLQE
ncbi:MAG: hypothetical protein ACRETD_06570 [Steroidobacteraceae bacterium]